MARKSNKTNHVLNLISNGGDASLDEIGNQARPPIDPEQSTISVVQPKEAGSQIAEKIRESLEESIQEDENEQEENVAETREQVTKEYEEQEEKEADNQADEQTEEQVPDSKDEDCVAEEKPEEVARFISVMEHIVKEQVLEYMENFGCCTCSRCIADTMALALTNLPAKYIVVNDNDVSPLLNYYSTKYASLVMIELTKASIQVKENPHHNKE